jgi:hypothetical protein
VVPTQERKSKNVNISLILPEKKSFMWFVLCERERERESERDMEVVREREREREV